MVLGFPRTAVVPCNSGSYWRLLLELSAPVLECLQSFTEWSVLGNPIYYIYYLLLLLYLLFLLYLLLFTLSIYLNSWQVNMWIYILSVFSLSMCPWGHILIKPTGRSLCNTIMSTLMGSGPLGAIFPFSDGRRPCLWSFCTKSSVFWSEDGYPPPG